jgi:hypothetical protein
MRAEKSLTTKVGHFGGIPPEKSKAQNRAAQPRTPANPAISGLREKGPEFRGFAEGTYMPIARVNWPSVSGPYF